MLREADPQHQVSRYQGEAPERAGIVEMELRPPADRQPQASRSQLD
jgi:hypothetical protein